MLPKYVPFICALILFVAAESEPQGKRARVESCPGCSLNRLPEVKKFIYEDLPKYDGVDFKKIHGAKPELVVLNDADEEIERLPLSGLSRKQCNDELKARGFALRSNEKLEL